MDMIYIDSSNIESVGYDQEIQELQIRFLTGALYSYSGVPEEIYDELMAASSKGSFYNREIRSVYDYAKL